MAQFQYAVLSQARPGQAEEFVRWYRDQHLADVLRIPGVVSGDLIQLDFQRAYDLEAPQWTLLALYELQGDNPESIISAIKSASGAEGMPMSDALTKQGMLQVAGHRIASLGHRTDLGGSDFPRSEANSSAGMELPR